MGVACATLPTSSSFCMIFFMRAFLSAKGSMIGLCFSKVFSDARNWGRTTGNLVCLFLFFMTDVRGWDLTIAEPEKIGAWDVYRESQSQVTSHRLNSNNNCCTFPSCRFIYSMGRSTRARSLEYHIYHRTLHICILEEQVLVHEFFLRPRCPASLVVFVRIFNNWTGTISSHLNPNVKKILVQNILPLRHKLVDITVH